MRRVTVVLGSLAVTGTLTLSLVSGAAWAAQGTLGMNVGARHVAAPISEVGKQVAAARIQTAKIVAGLGGIENIDEVRGELLQIDVEVVDPSLVDEVALKAAGARSVVKNGEKVTVVLGEEAPRVATEIEDMM